MCVANIIDATISYEKVIVRIMYKFSYKDKRVLKLTLDILNSSSLYLDIVKRLNKESFVYIICSGAVEDNLLYVIVKGIWIVS